MKKGKNIIIPLYYGSNQAQPGVPTMKSWEIRYDKVNDVYVIYELSPGTQSRLKEFKTKLEAEEYIIILNLQQQLQSAQQQQQSWQAQQQAAAYAQQMAQNYFSKPSLFKSGVDQKLNFVITRVASDLGIPDNCITYTRSPMHGKVLVEIRLPVLLEIPSSDVVHSSVDDLALNLVEQTWERAYVKPVGVKTKSPSNDATNGETILFCDDI